MTKSQEQRMNEFIENRMSGHNGDISNLIKSYMKESYQAAMKEAEVLVDALEAENEQLKWLAFEYENTDASDFAKRRIKTIELAIKKFKGE